MHAPVNQRAAAGDCLGGESAAQAGDGAMGTERSVDVEHFAQLAALDIFTDQVHGVVEAVHHADVQRHAGFMLHLLHFEGLGIGAGGGLFAQHVLSGLEEIDGDGGMDGVGRADGDRLDLGIVQDLVIIIHGFAAAVFFHGGVGAFGDDVAEPLDLHVGVFHVRRDVGAVGDGAAADDGNFQFAHGAFSFIPFCC